MTIQKDRFNLFPTRKFSFVKLSVFAAFFFAVVLCCAVTQADIVMSLTKISSEADVFTNVPNSSSVKYAINYGSVGVDGNIDGVTFANSLGNGVAGYYSVYSYKDAEETKINYGYNSPQASWDARSSTGTATKGQTYEGSTITQLDKLLSSVIYNHVQPANSTSIFTFGNLEAGKTYTARILSRSWGTDNPNRQHTFSIDTNADGVAETFTYNGNQVTGQMVSQDQPFSGETYGGVYSVDFTFTAQSNTTTISLLSGDTTDQAWNNYGVMLIETTAEQVKPTTPTLYNGSFEVDNFVVVNANTQHGYVTDSNSGIVTGWEFTNLTNDSTPLGLAWTGSPCQHFLNNQTPPDGTQVAFVQSSGDRDARLYQNVYGFNPDDKNTVYRVTMDLGGRPGTGDPVASLFIGADQATEGTYINSKTISRNGFKEYSAVFAPNSDVQTIAISNKTSGDTSLLVDNVQLQAYELTTFFTDNYKVTSNRNGSSIGKGSTDAADRFGGLLGALGYVVRGSDAQTQVGHNYSKTPHDACTECNNNCIDSLFLVAKNDASESHASPNYDFANVGAMSAAEEGGRMYDVSFKVLPASDAAVYDTTWAAVVLGTTQGKQTVNVNQSDGIGILFRKNGGVQIFDGTNGQAQQNFGAETFDLIDGWANVRIVYYVTDFNGTSPVEVSLYINDKLISSFQTGKGFNGNYIQLEGYGGGENAWCHSFITDLSVKATAEFYYDVSRIQDLNREWAPNGKDKLDVFFNAPRSDGATEAVHTGAITLNDNVEINVAEDCTLKQTGDVTGDYTITKTGDGVLQIYGAAEGDVDIESLVVSSGRVDVKGYMTGSVLVGEGAVFSPGNSVGTVVIDGEFKTEPYAILLFEQDASGMDSLTASSFDLDDDTQFVLDITAIVPGATYDIIISSDEEFTEDDSVWLDKLSEIVPDYFDFSIVDNHIVRLYTNPNKVPEPSTWALLVLGVVVLLLRKRS